MSQPTLGVDGATALSRGAGCWCSAGIEVYPTASAKEYEDRLIGPFRRSPAPRRPQPLLFALPGNHDWYDGLTAFLRIFTQERNIGGWRTVQRAATSPSSCPMAGGWSGSTASSAPTSTNPR